MTTLAVHTLQPHIFYRFVLDANRETRVGHLPTPISLALQPDLIGFRPRYGPQR